MVLYLFLSKWFDLWKALNVYTNVASFGDDFVLLCLSCLFFGSLRFLCQSLCGSLLIDVWFSSLICVCDLAALTLGLFQFYQPVNQLPGFHPNIK